VAHPVKDTNNLIRNIKHIIVFSLGLALLGCQKETQQSRLESRDERAHTQQSVSTEPVPNETAANDEPARLRSDQMSYALAAPAPEWLALRAPIQVKQVDIGPPKADPRSIGLRPAGSARSIELQGKKILFDASQHAGHL